LIRKVFKVKSKDWRSPGDTYFGYCQRCDRMGIEARSFSEWLKFELTIAEPRGHRGHIRPKLDEHQRHFVNA
jgi:hypothetical protein